MITCDSIVQEIFRRRDTIRQDKSIIIHVGDSEMICIRTNETAATYLIIRRYVSVKLSPFNAERKFKFLK